MHPSCDCLEPQYTNNRWPTLRLHAEVQDTQCSAWERLMGLIEQAAADGREEFAPVRDLGLEDSWQIVALPPEIARLKAVKVLRLYSSALVRLPPEIGEMAALEELDVYTSYRLHWFPYEITRCANLKRSRVSTRALYGNYKYRPPFPRLPQNHVEEVFPKRCSVCGGRFGPAGPKQRWISLWVASRDVLPLLVHACSDGCIERLPRPPQGYVQTPHTGGIGVRQPPRCL